MAPAVSRVVPSSLLVSSGLGASSAEICSSTLWALISCSGARRVHPAVTSTPRASSSALRAAPSLTYWTSWNVAGGIVSDSRSASAADGGVGGRSPTGSSTICATHAYLFFRPGMALVRSSHVTPALARNVEWKSLRAALFRVCRILIRACNATRERRRLALQVRRTANVDHPRRLGPISRANSAVAAEHGTRAGRWASGNRPC